MKISADWHGEASQGRSDNSVARLLGWVVLGVMFLALCGRVLDFPLNRDENLFVTVAVMGGFGNLYGELGYNHLPYLPWLLGAIYRLTGTAHYLFVGRMVVLLGWAAIVLALWLIARRRHAGFAAFCTAAVLLMGNTLLLGAPGMLVSNNLLPVPAALFALYFLLGGVDAQAPSPMRCLVAGLFASFAVGLKANYIFLAPVLAGATLMAPQARAFTTRLRGQTLPLAIGGLLGGLPVLLLMVVEPGPFFAHTIRYFTQMQTAYWAHAPEPQVASMAQKVMLAESVWISGTSLLMLTGSATLLALAATRQSWRDTVQHVGIWPIVMMACLVGCGLVVAFVPTPSFAQYFVPPIPFMAVLLVLLRGETRAADGRVADGMLAALVCVGLLCGAPRVAPGLLELMSPARWHSVTVHREMRALAAKADLQGGESTVTITPVLALEAGLTVPPQFAAGQFVYRVADYLPAGDRPWYTTTSPSHLDSYLDAHHPAVILVSGEERLEAPFVRYARTHGYREFALAGKQGGPRLFRRP